MYHKAVAYYCGVVFAANMCEGVDYINYYRHRSTESNPKPTLMEMGANVCIEISGRGPLTSYVSMTVVALAKSVVYGLFMPVSLPKMIYDAFHDDLAQHIKPGYIQYNMKPLYNKVSQ